jgi:hypothetical protein
MRISDKWQKEPGTRVAPSRDLDDGKVQAPCIVRRPDGGVRLFYTGIGSGKPFPNCQGYILSAVSDDGVTFEKEPGIRLMPQPDVLHMSLRVLAPSIVKVANGWRMYFESRGPAAVPCVICSAFSSDQLNWEHEDGVRLQAWEDLGGPRYMALPDGGGRLYCCGSLTDADDGGVVSATTIDGLDFEIEPAYRITAKQNEYDSGGCTAAEVISIGDEWSMVFSTWQDPPPGTEVPLHPCADSDAENNGVSADFAAASIAVDMAGYRSRIYMAYSSDGLVWNHGGCAIDGAGYDRDGFDAVHAEDMSVIQLDDGRYRMYIAGCDKNGRWSVGSAVSE